MRPISPKVKAILQEEPNVCARANKDCEGCITWEHSIIYAGRQLDEAWAIIKLCEKHHSVNMFQDTGLLDKEINEWIALNRATTEELRRISKAENYLLKRERLNKKYGIFGKKFSS